MRNIPDVAMIATDVLVISNDGTNSANSGTSIAAPLWAGFTALVNEQAVVNGLPTVGFLNPALYAIGQGPNYTNCFHDIIRGNNGLITFSNNVQIPPCAIYYATNGYDLCTGWGSPNGTNLINALMPYTGAIWVDFNYNSSPQNGSYDAPFITMAEGVAAVTNKGNIWIRTAGSSPEAMIISKPMTIRAANGAATIGR